MGVTFLPDGSFVALQPGRTVLELSRHTVLALRSVCGGLGQCTACRVRVVSGAWPPGRTDRVRLGSLVEQGWRLACQFGPRAALVVNRPQDVPA